MLNTFSLKNIRLPLMDFPAQDIFVVTEGSAGLEEISLMGLLIRASALPWLNYL